MTKILLIGQDARMDCIAETLLRSHRSPEIYTYATLRHPGLLAKSKEYHLGSLFKPDHMVEYAQQILPDFVIIGSENEIALGTANAFLKAGIPCIAPTQELAQLETSKIFTRTILQENNMSHWNPSFRIFESMDGLQKYLKSLEQFVIKPDNLSGGKGVYLYPDHFASVEKAVQHCRDFFFQHPDKALLIEEYLDGVEFSLQSLVDGEHVIHLPFVHDYKRSEEGDYGYNTGGMGSYSCENHLLPFLTAQHIEESHHINETIITLMKTRYPDHVYKGILYGGFIITKDGLKLLEYNVRFGDPEVMNILPILKEDFITICEHLIGGTLHQRYVQFDRKAIVCKYLVPEGYPHNPVRNKPYTFRPTNENLQSCRVYYASTEERRRQLHQTASRTLAFIGIGNTVEEAERIAESAFSQIGFGAVTHRRDIGTSFSIQQQVVKVLSYQ